MAKRQQFIAGSTNPITNKALTTEQMNLLWNRLAVLKSDILNGTFFQQSTYSYDSSNEIANALERFGMTLDADNNSQLADLLETIRNTSLVFKGFVSTTEPDATTYALVEGNLWINSATMPTTFPVPVADIKVWNGTAWADATQEYTPFTLDIFRDINTNNGYYWLGGQWVIMSTDMSTLYFQLDAAGKWEIKNSIQLPGSPSVETMGATPASIPTKEYVDTAVADGTAGIGFFPGYIGMYTGKVAPAGWLLCQGGLVKQSDYPNLFAVDGHDWSPYTLYGWTYSGTNTTIYTMTPTGSAGLMTFTTDGTDRNEKTTAGSAGSITVTSHVYARNSSKDHPAPAVLRAWSFEGNIVYTEVPMPRVGDEVWNIENEVLVSVGTVGAYTASTNSITIAGSTTVYTRDIPGDDKGWFYLPDKQVTTSAITSTGALQLYTSGNMASRICKQNYQVGGYPGTIDRFTALNTIDGDNVSNVPLIYAAGLSVQLDSRCVYIIKY